MKNYIRRGIQLGSCALVMVCAACSEQGREPPVQAAVSGEPPPVARESDMSVASIGEILTRQVSEAVADLSDRLGVAVNDIRVVQARSVQWGSGALGCPEEGMNYTQAIVPGVLVILETNGVSYRYHGRAKANLVYCPEERANEPAYGVGKEFM